MLLVDALNFIIDDGIEAPRVWEATGRAGRWREINPGADYAAPLLPYVLIFTDLRGIKRTTMGHKVVQAKSSHEYWLDRFCVAPELLGAKHLFEHAGRYISVELPATPQEDSKLDREFWDVECYKWLSAGHVPLEYKVNRVRLRATIGTDIAVPEEALKVSPRRDELFTKPERDHLDNLIKGQSGLALDAFRHWLSVLRWKSRVGHIGEPQVRNSGHSTGGAALQDSASGHRFWLQGHIIVGQGSKAVTPSGWQLAQAALKESKSPPIWFDFVFQGEQRINNHDLTGAVLSLAIALEAIVRTLVTHHLSEISIEPLISKIVDRANFRSILSGLRSLSFWDDGWEQVVDFSSFNALMDYRDRVMHSADTKDLERKKLRATHTKVEALAYFVSEFLGKE